MIERSHSDFTAHVMRCSWLAGIQIARVGRIKHAVPSVITSITPDAANTSCPQSQ